MCRKLVKRGINLKIQGITDYRKFGWFARDQHLHSSYIAEGELTDDQLETFGGYGVVRIKNLKSLLRHSSWARCRHPKRSYEKVYGAGRFTDMEGD